MTTEVKSVWKKLEPYKPSKEEAKREQRWQEKWGNRSISETFGPCEANHTTRKQRQACEDCLDWDDACRVWGCTNYAISHNFSLEVFRPYGYEEYKPWRDRFTNLKQPAWDTRLVPKKS